jgi:ligand-binding SRPBCC domain-containing protein
MIHTLHRTQFIPAPLETVWAFFADPRNLNAITPPDMRLDTVGTPEPTRVGQLIAYRVRLGLGIRVSWLTEIRYLRVNEYFVDEQRLGPYKFWYHEHHFVARDGGVEMTDHVTYALPFGPIGSLTHRLWVRPKLDSIFDFRRQQIACHFPSAS